MSSLIYFSSASENTARFVAKLGIDALRLPLYTREDAPVATEPYVLIVPTYGGGDGGGAIPKQVLKFFREEPNRNYLRGVIAAGNTNFGTAYGLAGDKVAAKFNVPMLYRFELMGTAEDVERVRDGLAAFWSRPHTDNRPAEAGSAVGRSAA